MTEGPVDPTLWLLKVGALCGGNVLNGEELGRRMEPLKGPLMNLFPPRAFTQASAEHVALAQKKWPTHESISGALMAWLRTHRAPLPAIAGPDPWGQRVEEERRQAARDWADPAKVRSSMAKILAKECRACGCSYGADEIGAGIRCPDCGKGTLLQHPQKDLLGRMLGGLVMHHAPQNLHLLLPAWIAPPPP